MTFRIQPLRHARFLSTMAGGLCLLLPAVGALGDDGFTQEFKTEHGFTVRLTDDWREVPADVLKPLDQKMTEMAHSPQNWQYAYQLKSSNHWLAYPYILIQFFDGRKSEGAFRKDFEAKAGMQRGLDEASQKASGLLSEPQVGSYNYDSTNHTVDFLTEVNLNGMGKMEGYTSLRLTEEGVIEFCGYCTAADKDEFVPFFQNAANHIGLSETAVYQPRILDRVPILGAIDFSQAGTEAMIGAVVGALVVLVGRFLRRKRE